MTPAAPPDRPAFAHASEAELARILDFYQVRWSYEPDTFPIGWSITGEVVESFSPDFYLPDLDLYVELTTLKQSLVRKKNRKLRRLRELYPDVHIKLFYARDFRMLLLKFGRLALLDDLSGTTGQATPPRPAERILLEAGAAARLGEPTGAAAGLPDAGAAAGPGGPPVAATLPPVTVTAPPGGADAAVTPADAADGGQAGPARSRPVDAVSPRPTPTGRGRRRGRRRRNAPAVAGEGLLAGTAPDDEPDAP